MSRTLAAPATRLGPIALGVSILAVALCVTIWLSLLGAPLGLVGLVLGFMAVRKERRAGRTSRSGVAAIVLSALAVLSLPFLAVACNSGLSCV
jgi:hypothetical protein